MIIIHDASIAHKDIKPENILFSEDDIPKIADSGLGKRLLDPSHSKGFKGTPYYSAPEQFDDDTYGEISYKTDIYQIGAVYYELLTGKTPFPYKNLNKLLKYILTEKPTPPSKVNLNIPKILDEIVLKAMAKKQSERYEFMEMAKIIESVIK